LIPGTYALRICRGRCTGSRADSILTTGRLVVEQDSISTAALPAEARDYVENHTGFLLIRGEDRVQPNACFVVGRPPSQARTYAGFEPAGFTRIEPRLGDSLAVPLFQSPDAGYALVLGRRGSALAGRGHSWGAGDARVSYPDDSVWARRIGPPRREICLRGIEAAAASRRARQRGAAPRTRPRRPGSYLHPAGAGPAA
jgi:hypothetical protein